MINATTLGAAFCATVLMALASTAYAREFEGSAAVVSDYRWRGVSLSDGDPSLQLEGSLSYEGGAWLWGGLNSVSADYGGSEIGLGLGYTRTLAGADWTVSAIHYVYPGEAAIDYTELDVSVSRAVGPFALTIGIEYVPEQNNYEDGDDLYSFVGWEAAAPHDVTVHGHFGWDDGIMAPVPGAFDYSVGAGLPLGPLAFDLTYVEVEGDDAAWVLKLAYQR